MPDKGTTPRTCQQCGSAFLATKTSVNQGQGKFCSRTCSNYSRRAVADAVTNCECCGVAIYVTAARAKRRPRRFCSKACVAKTYVSGTANYRWSGGPEQRLCQSCGASFVAPRQQINKGLARFCSVSCARKGRTGEENGRWKGGRFFSGYYWYVKVEDGSYRAEHRVVVEQTIGRLLTTDEHIHHINHIKTDNRPENLQIVTASEHARIHGTVPTWSHDFPSCISCGTTERPHKGYGRCTNCYARLKRARR